MESLISMLSTIDIYDTQRKWCESWWKYKPKLKFGRNKDNNVLNQNPRIGREILLRFQKNPRWRQNGRLTHFSAYLDFYSAMTLIFSKSVDNDVLNLNPRIGENNLLRFLKKIQDGGQMGD